MSEADLETDIALQPSSSFFADPATDRIVSAMLALASEVWVLTERMTTMEALAAAKGFVTLEELKGYKPSDAEMAEREQAGKDFVYRVLGQLREFPS